ncbi:isochorismate synthase [Lutibacter agarilyticus]|uniref:isochorismate synthase n=1 Tax=Lutibacter agarilyticus TaxID=1109740 RepID=A0A238XJ95_9FLAO|nr:isochorismate synthase [Lutibacter agarilyticus]SNR58658.1 isochorismate synthase [Lutibacter agarilyticus]
MQEITLFFEKIEGIINSNLPFVVYRKPNENLVTVIVQNTTKMYTVNSFMERGFVFAPFNKKEASIIFPANKTTTFSITIKDFNEVSNVEQNAKTKIISDLEKEKEQHILLTQKTIEFIEQKAAEKIVISRKETIKYSQLKVLESFKRMLKNYQNAMVYLWFHPNIGCWMGASPERLIHIQNNQFKTMALAATQAYVDTTNVTWKQKEQQEQQFVTNYILNTIEKTIDTIKVSKPYTIKAGSLLHIRTDITGKLTSEKMLGELVNALHPTPAVCGVPKQIATNFIVENENYHRKFYTGYLGELNVHKETNLYVNLRCMEVESETIALYIGGGITKDSVAEKEWNETVFKGEIMKTII